MRLLADQNFNDRVIRGLLRLVPLLDVVRTREVGLTEASDDAVLEWAAQEGRIVLTHDIRTMVPLAQWRAGDGQRMPGLVLVPIDLATGRAIEELVTFVECSLEGEWEGRVLHLPL